MSDIEKYGLFAVLFVGGILLLIAVGGGFSDEPEPGALATAGGPVVLEQPAALAPPGGQPRGLDVVRVPPLLPTDKPFTYEEPPIAYPGERSTSAPALSIAPASPPAEPPAPQKSVVLESPPVEAQPAATYVIREGDTLADIAKKHLGSATKWEELVKLNPGINPKNLKIGQTLRLSGAAPVAVTPTAAPAAGKIDATGSRTHKVASGDTLGAIARKYLGSITKADAIYQANRDVLKSPDSLKVGQVLRIP